MHSERFSLCALCALGAWQRTQRKYCFSRCGSVPITVTYIGSSVQFGEVSTGVPPGTQPNRADPPVLRAALGRAGWPVPRVTAGRPGCDDSVRGVAARLPQAISIPARFARHLASWAGCPPLQLGHLISVWGHTFPTFPQATTSHLCSSVL